MRDRIANTEEKLGRLRDERGDLVRSAHRRGLTAEEIAAEVGLSVGRVRAILREEPSTEGATGRPSWAKSWL